MIKHFAVLKNPCFAAAAICSFAAFVSLAPPASATGSQLDQSNLPTVTATDSINTSESFAQTFTVGIQGVLTDVELSLSETGSPNAPLAISITTLTGSQPNLSNVIGSGTVQESSLSGSAQLITASLSVQPAVTVGEQLAIVLTTTASIGNYIWWDDDQPDYAGGSAVENLGGGWSGVSWDKAFATFVGQPVAGGVAPRGAYCTVAGNTSDLGASLAVGTFVNLDDGQAWSDPHYAGATPAIFVAGKGLMCGAPPAGYTQHGYATPDMNVDGNTYPYYSL